MESAERFARSHFSFFRFFSLQMQNCVHKVSVCVYLCTECKDYEEETPRYKPLDAK